MLLTPLTGVYVAYLFRRELRDASRGIFSGVRRFIGEFFEVNQNPQSDVIRTVDIGNLIDELVVTFFSVLERHADFLRAFFESPYF